MGLGCGKSLFQHCSYKRDPDPEKRGPDFSFTDDKVGGPSVDDLDTDARSMPVQRRQVRARRRLVAPRKPVAVAETGGGGATYTVFGASALPTTAPTPNPSNPAPTAEPLPAWAEPVSESAARLLPLRRLLCTWCASEKPSSGDNAAPTHDKLRLSSGVISELLRARKRRWCRTKQRPPGYGGLCQSVSAWATTPLFATRH